MARDCCDSGCECSAGRECACTGTGASRVVVAFVAGTALGALVAMAFFNRERLAPHVLSGARRIRSITPMRSFAG